MASSNSSAIRHQAAQALAVLDRQIQIVAPFVHRQLIALDHQGLQVALQGGHGGA
jgi:hypothetical protein